LGTILCFIASIIIQFNPCLEPEIKSNNNNNKSSNSINQNIKFYNITCQIRKINDTKIAFFYDNYYAYFNIFIKNILISIIIFILKTTFSFFKKVCTLYIIKNLSPEYIVCSDSLYYFITEVIDLCYSMFSDYEDNNINKDKYNDYKRYKIYGMIIEIICFIGSLIY